MFLFFRRQKSLALNTTDEIPEDKEFENHYWLRVVAVLALYARSRQILSPREAYAPRRILRLSDNYGYVRHVKSILDLAVLFSTQFLSHGGIFRVTRIKCFKSTRRTLTPIVSSDTIVVTSLNFFL